MKRNVNNITKYILVSIVFLYCTKSYANSIEDYKFMGDYYVEQNNYAKALIFYEKALKLYKGTVNIKLIDKANFYNALSFLYVKNTKYNKALKYKLYALDVYENKLGINNITTASCYHNTGDIYFNLSQYSTALNYGKKALSIFESLDINDTYKAHAYSLVGTYYYYLGNNVQALYFDSKALKIFQKNFPEENILIAMVYNNLAEIYKALGSYSKALKFYKKSLKITKKSISENDIRVSILYSNLGDVYQSLNLNIDASNYFLKSLEIRENIYGKFNIQTTYAYIELSDFYKKNNQYKKAFKYINKALQVLEKPIYKKHLYTSFAYETISELYFKKEDYVKSLEYLNKTISIQKEILGKNHIRIAYSYKDLSAFLNFFDLKKEAYIYIEKAFSISENSRKNNFLILGSDEKQVYLSEHKYFISHLLNSSIKYKINNIKITFNHWLNYKGSIFDSENSIATLYTNTKDQALKEKIETLTANQRSIANLYQNIQTDQIKWNKKIKSLEEKISKLTIEIAKKSSIFQEEQGLKSIDYKNITKNLKNNELYIDYAKAGDYYYIFTLDNKEQIEFIQIDENSTKKIDNLVISFRAEVKSIIDNKMINESKLKLLTESSKEKLSQLYELIIKNPLKEKLDSKSSLIISPDGALRLLPFETLYDKEKQQYLIQSKKIRYIPSGKEFVRLHKYAKNRVTNRDETVVFANPNFDSNETAPYHESITLTRGTNENIIKPFFQIIYEPLIGTKLEAEEINKTMDNVKIFEWNRANETNFLKVEEPKILHIATHGFFINHPTIPNPMLKSGIILSGANHSARQLKGYGRVTALKLSGLNLKGTDLVVLSACETGVVDINNTDSISGLGKAFIQAGTKDVVMSLWSVDDNATKELMVSFYKQIKEKPNYSLALKKAKLKMIDEDMHPFYWGGFVILGL